MFFFNKEQGQEKANFGDILLKGRHENATSYKVETFCVF